MALVIDRRLYVTHRHRQRLRWRRHSAWGDTTKPPILIWLCALITLGASSCRGGFDQDANGTRESEKLDAAPASNGGGPGGTLQDDSGIGPNTDPKKEDDAQPARSSPPLQTPPPTEQQDGGSEPSDSGPEEAVVVPEPDGGWQQCRAVAALSGTSLVFDEESATGATSAGVGLFDFPWPELFRPNSQLKAFPNPSTASGCAVKANGELLTRVLEAIPPPKYRAYLAQLLSTEATGSSTAGAVFMRFDGPLTEALPDAAASLDPASPILLVNIDANSPDLGALVPVHSRVYTQSRYLAPNTLSLLPDTGFPMAPETRYAAVVRRSLGDADQQPLGSPADFEALKSGLDCGPRHKIYGEAFEVLEALHGVAREQVAAMSVFETAAPNKALEQVGAELGVLPISTHAGVEVISETVAAEGHTVIDGSLITPIQQHGTPPYLPQISVSTTAIEVGLAPEAEDGGFLEGTPFSGTAEELDSPRGERIRFRLILPVGVSDGAELPVVLYAPGTGGGLNSPLNNGIAQALTGAGMAVFVAESVMHGDRSHVDNIDSNLVSLLGLSDGLTGTTRLSELQGVVTSGDLFFNPLNLRAARGNSFQGAVDYIWQSRILAESVFPLMAGGSLRFNRVSYFGHSQGGSLGTLLSSAKELSSLVLSAPGAHIPSLLLDKTEPSDRLTLSSMLEQVVCDDPREPLDSHHPLLSLVGQWFAPVDGANYASSLLGSPPAAPRSLLIQLGVDDHYSPPSSNHALVTAARVPQAGPALTPVPGHGLLSLVDPNGGWDSPSAPLQGNVRGGTVGFRQYDGTSCSDPHFVYTCVDMARTDWLSFLTSSVTGPPLIP